MAEVRDVHVAGGGAFKVARLWCVNGIVVPSTEKNDEEWFMLCKSWNYMAPEWLTMLTGRKQPFFKDGKRVKVPPCELACTILRAVNDTRGPTNRRVRRAAKDGGAALDAVTIAVEGVGCNSGESTQHSMRVCNDKATALVSATADNLEWLLHKLYGEVSAVATIVATNTLETPVKDPKASCDGDDADGGDDADSDGDDSASGCGTDAEVSKAVDKRALPVGVHFASSHNAFIVVCG